MTQLETDGGNKTTQPLSVLRERGEKGDVSAQKELALRYEFGLHDTRKDSSEAQRWFRLAAEQGDADSKRMLDTYGWTSWLRKARGDVTWMARRVVAAALREPEPPYWESEFTLPEEVEAREYNMPELLFTGEVLGQRSAQKELGFRYEFGERGAEKDTKAAQQWFRRAAEQGDAQAKEMLDSYHITWADGILSGILALIWAAGLALAVAAPVLRVVWSIGTVAFKTLLFGIGSLALLLLVGNGIWFIADSVYELPQSREDLEAVLNCPKQIERLARYQFRWTDAAGFTELKLALSHTVRTEDPGVLTYVGDKIEFQNQYGAWQPHVYECNLDIVTGEVLDTRAMPGRLPE